ncbi:MAG: PASTA domain-containing protein [Candidatus Limnocylindrales bacterium]
MPHRLPHIRLGPAASRILGTRPSDAPTPAASGAAGGAVETVVPDVRGSTEDEAIERLVAAGLVVERLGADRSDGPPTGCVLRTRPPAGSVVVAGATVGYIVASPLWP